MEGRGLLAKLDAEHYNLIVSKSKSVIYHKQDVLLQSGEVIYSVYFPITGWVSLVARLASGRSAEVGIVGSEGMVGLPVLLGESRNRAEWLVQNPGLILRMDAAVFQKIVDDVPAIKAALLRYALDFQEQLTQTAVCNAVHTIEQRLARWLLMARDRTGADELPLTQETLATMLGVRRSGITVAAGLLQKSGMISYGQGSIRIVDAADLEEVAGECYRPLR